MGSVWEHFDPCLEHIKHTLTIIWLLVVLTFLIKFMSCERMGRGCLGFGRILDVFFPTSFPELPVQLRDLRNNQKSLKTNFLISITNPNTSVIFPDIPFLKAYIFLLQRSIPDLRRCPGGGLLVVESDVDVEECPIGAPEAT